MIRKTLTYWVVKNKKQPTEYRKSNFAKMYKHLKLTQSITNPKN